MLLLTAAAGLMCVVVSAAAQTAQTLEAADTASSAPQKYPAPTNLKVLPKDMSGADVHELMEQWTKELGTDCANCHTRDPKDIGPNGKPRLNYADDKKEEKNTARVMYTMTESINANFIATVPNSGVPVDCGTCHRGHNSPELFKPNDLEQAKAAPSATTPAANPPAVPPTAAPAATANTAATGIGAAIGPAIDPGSKDFYQARIEPILKENCMECHNDDKLKGGLVMDSYTTLMQGGDDGYVIVPGDPDASMLIQGIRHQGDMKPMPPKKNLDQASIDALVAWVKAGAKGPDGATPAIAAQPAMQK